MSPDEQILVLLAEGPAGTQDLATSMDWHDRSVRRRLRRLIRDGYIFSPRGDRCGPVPVRFGIGFGLVTGQTVDQGIHSIAQPNVSGWASAFHEPDAGCWNRACESGESTSFRSACCRCHTAR